MAVDGSTNGTRKMNAAAPAFLTSVTTPSLTSPAATNLTLGLGTGGTALTLTSSTLAATFAGSVTTTGNAATTPSLILNNSSGSAINQYYANFTAGATVIARALRGNGVAGYSDNGLNIDNFGGFQIGLNVLGGSGESFKIRNAGTTDLLTITSTGAATFAGAVTVSSSTAGSAGAGALVLTTGGLATGAASYIGGGLTVNGTITSTAGNNTALFLNLTATTGYQYIAIQSTGAGLRIGIEDSAGAALVAGSSPYDTFIGTANATGLTLSTNGTKRLRIDSAGAATFAGAVSITGNVGFYGQAATAKPTGVAVTAAAIHAALVTLNLIAV